VKKDEKRRDTSVCKKLLPDLGSSVKCQTILDFYKCKV
jgi:hypothetical protein